MPDALRDRFWWTASHAGLLGTTARLGVPSGERIVHVADGLVVSARGTGGTASTITLMVREFETGAEIRQVLTDLAGVDARVMGRRLLWSGMSKVDNDRDRAIDGGVWAVDVDGGEPAEIVPSGTEIDTTWAGRRLLLSPSARTVGAVLDTLGDDAFMDVIDVDSLDHDGRLHDVWPWAITDGAFLQWDQQPSDFMAPGWGMTAYGLADGDRRWGFPDGEEVDRFAPHPVMALGEEFVVEYFWEGGSSPDQRILAAFDPRTGERRELLRQDAELRSVLVTRVELSTATHVLLEHADRDTADTWLLSTLEIATGTLTRDAFSIEPPLPCDGGACWYE